MTLATPPPRSRPTSRSTAPSKTAPKPPTSVGLLLFTCLSVIVYLCALVYSFSKASAEVWGALLLLPILIGITLPLCSAVGRAQNDVRLTRLLGVALVLKMIGACVRYAVAFQVYNGEADSRVYDHAGRQLAAHFRAGHFDFGTGAIKNTHFIEVLTGIIYAIIGNTQLGGFFVYSWLGFLGLYFFYRAFALAVPRGDHRRYALLLFFMPSLLFWSSSIGKEAWMTLTLGMVAYGAARAFARKPFGFVFLGLGLWGTEVVRPHMALLILGGLVPAYLIRRAPAFSDTKRKQSLKMFGLAALVVAIVITLGGVEQRFKVSTVDAQTADQVFTDTQDQTTQGGSSFTPTRVHNPIQLPVAVVTVLFRPFPGEASTTQGVVSAFEGAFLMIVCLRSLRRLRRIPAEMIQTPYVLFALVYVLVFVYAFSTIGNFGILVRQRVQVYPLFFVLLAIPAMARKREDSRTKRRSYAR
jgi:hypothetical protein